MHVFRVLIEENDPPIEIVVAELLPGQSIEALFEQLYKDFDADVRVRASAFIVRPAVMWPIAPEVLSALVSKVEIECPKECEFVRDALKESAVAFARAGGKPVHILSSRKYAHFVSANINPEAATSLIDGGALQVEQLLEEIRRAELDLAVETGRAKLPSAPGVLYRAPSKRLMKSFLRVGNVQRSRSVLDGIFFWLLPYLQNCVGILTDTWSISSISMNASRRLCVYQGAGFGPCPVEMLDHYHDGSPARTTEAAEIVERFIIRGYEREGEQSLGQGQVLILISATHTGSLVQSLRTLLREREVTAEQVSFVALFKLGASQIEMPTLRDLSAGIGAAEFAEVSPGDRESVEPIEIDEQVYFPRQYRDFKYPVRIAQARPVSEFFNRYKEVDLVRVHHTDESDRPARHNAIWINTVALVRNAAFRQKFRAYLNTLNPVPTLIVTPLHTAGRILGEIAQGALMESNPSVQIVSHSNLRLNSSLSADVAIATAIDAVSDDGAILILDDAFITGGRLATYQAQMRSRKFKGRIHYVVAVARPQFLSDWELQRRILGHRPTLPSGEVLPGHSVNAIDTIVLPDWHENGCPWCAELNFYRAQEKKLGAALSADVLRTRLAKLLTNRIDGMSAELFLEMPERPAMQITPTSIFVEAPASNAVVFAAVAGAIQSLRGANDQDRPPLGPRRFPLSTVLDDNDYLHSVFTDAILRVCFLRAAKVEELVYANPMDERRREEHVANLLNADESAYESLALELLFASTIGKVPKIDIAAFPKLAGDTELQNVAEIFM